MMARFSKFDQLNPRTGSGRVFRWPINISLININATGVPSVARAVSGIARAVLSLGSAAFRNK
jgi:hypothetical protein